MSYLLYRRVTKKATSKCADHAVVNYAPRFTPFTIFRKFVGEVTPKEITVKVIDQSVQSQSEQGLKPGTINRRLSVISSFFEHLIIENEDDQWQNPVRWRRHSIRPGRHLPRDVSDQSVEALLAVIEDSRDRAMVMLMIGAGLRIGEVVNLEMSDIDVSEFGSRFTRLVARTTF